MIIYVIYLVVWINLPNKLKFNLINKFNFVWGSFESESGIGSEIKNTKIIQDIIPKIIKKYKIDSILDCPCGDMNYMSIILNNLNNSDIKYKYTGYDIVINLINKNKVKYPELEFKEFDIINNKLENPFDLIIIKDLLNHLSTSDIKKIFYNLKNKGKYVLLNNSNTNTNINSITLAPLWNEINWKLSPWNLEIIEEYKSDGFDKDYILIKL